MICPACVVEIPDEDLFCENCGIKLGDSAPEVPQAKCVCGAPASETDEDGFCLRCGLRNHRTVSSETPREPQPSDHIEQQLSPSFAAVSDRGRRHTKNEDRFGILAWNGAYAIVVCDGVSTSQNAEVASTVVTAAVLESLSAALSATTPLEPAAAIRQAITAGAAALNAHANPYLEENPPSTTVVAALVAAGAATIGWLGDSRAYWIDLSDLPESPAPAEATQLTQDHSWLNAVVGSGEMTPELAAKSPQAHAITRWLGADAAEELEIDIVRHPLPESNGILLLSTDGLWNYFPTPEAMAALILNASRNGEDALAIARQLVDLANRRGGHDNITAAVLQHHQPKSGEPAKEV
jgi:serine/threonine protein phosphatase PrpC